MPHRHLHTIVTAIATTKQQKSELTYHISKPLPQSTKKEGAKKLFNYTNIQNFQTRATNTKVMAKINGTLPVEATLGDFWEFRLAEIDFIFSI